ncbi:MAG: hypothetical protein ACOYN3_04190 [Acidimicrobiia bacterium]
MAILVGVLIGVVILGIAGVLIAREALRTATTPPPPVFRLDEAYEWVVRHVPEDVAATLTPADVRRILALQIEFMKRKGVAVNGVRPDRTGPVVVGSSETVDYILERARVDGQEYLPEQVYPVIETQLAYMRAIGAIGGPAARTPRPKDQ